MITQLGLYIIGYSLTITGIGVTQHGKLPSRYAAEQMDNKLSEDGRYALNPQVGLIFKTENTQTEVLYLRDCFNKHAFSAAFGPKIDFLTYFSIGGAIGGYAREFPPNNVEKMPFSIIVDGWEVMPLAGATLSMKVPVTDKVSIETNVLLNGLINHANLGLRLDF